MKELHVRLITGTGLGLFAISLFFLPTWLFSIFIGLIVGRIIIWEWPYLFAFHNPLGWIILLFYLGIPCSLIIYMQVTHYETMNLILFSLVAAHDAGSYFIGKHFGTHLISPSLSPKKTWEGFFGGTICSFLFSLIFFGRNTWPLILGSILPLVLSINFAGLTGDLFESGLKRYAKLKDTDTILPGHGGLLDRVDSLLFASVIIFLARNWIIFLLAPL